MNPHCIGERGGGYRSKKRLSACAVFATGPPLPVSFENLTIFGNFCSLRQALYSTINGVSRHYAVS